MVDRFENFDISSIVSPVDADRLERLLKLTNYDKNETDYLVNGFRNGFDLEYTGPEDRQDVSKNLPFTVGNKIILWNKLMKEVKAGRVAGPFEFEQIPYKEFVQSPIGLVPKGESKTRMIFHLSFDFGDGHEINKPLHS